MYYINNKIALVTGGAQGIGEAIARHLRDAGAIVWIADKQEEKARETQLRLGDKVRYVPCDVTDPDQRVKLVRNICAQEGAATIDILINNAGGRTQAEHDLRAEHRGDFAKYPVSIYPDTFALNFYAPVEMMNLVIPIMQQGKRGGSIINISSVNAALALELPAYSTAKAALEEATALYARAYYEQGIRVNAIRAGPVDTEDRRRVMSTDSVYAGSISANMPLGLGSVDDIAQAVVFLTQNTLAGGMTLVLDGGFSLDTPYYRNSIIQKKQ